MLEDFFTLTEMKDGISTTARIAELVSEIQKLKDGADFSTADLIRQCSTAANTLASTRNEECLQQFVQLNGIGFLNQWLQDAQNCSKDVSSSAEDLIDAILNALERLPVDNVHKTSSGFMPTLQHLLAHRNTKINQKARLLCQKWSGTSKGGENDQHMDEKEAYQTDHLKPPEASQETENNKQDGANEAATAEAKSEREVLTCSDAPLSDPPLVSNNTDMTKQPPGLASQNFSDGNVIFGQVNSSASSLASQGGLANVSATEETSDSNDVGLVTNGMLRSDSLNIKSETGHGSPVASTLDAKSLETINPENSFDISKIDLGDQNVSSSLDIKKGNSFAADRSRSEKNAVEALNHLANVSAGLQYSLEESMGKEEGPTSSSGTDGKGTGSEFWLKRCVKSSGDSSKAAETKLTALRGDKSTPLTEYDDTDALEVARLVAIEVEREVIDYRGPFCGSPDISFRNVDSPHMKARQQADPPVDESNDNKSSSTGVDSGSSSSLKEDGSGITDDSGPFSGKQTRHVELGDFDLNENQYHEETGFHPKSNANNSVNLSTPIARAASRGSLVFPARLHFEGALGWKGSAATSAFQPASLRRTPDEEKLMSASSQKTSNLLFDLNVSESEIATAGESLSTAFLPFSSDIAPKDTSAAVGVSMGLELDLNHPCEEEEAATTAPNVPSFWSRQQCHGKWSQPSSCSSSTQPAARNFDLNDNVSILDASFQGNDASSVKTSVKDTSDRSEVTILGKRVTLGQKEYHDPSQYNFLGPSVGSRVPVRSTQSYAHMPPPDSSVFNYPSRSVAMSFPPPLYAPGGAPYMVDARGAPVMPPLSGLGVGISHPSFASRTIQAMPSEFGYFNPSMGVNYGLSSEGARRETGSYWPVPFQGHTVFVDEHMRNMSQGDSSGVVLKRKKPDSGWDIYPRH